MAVKKKTWIRKGELYMELAYRWEGDHLIPDLEMDRQPEGELRKFGLLRKKFLMENREGEFSVLLLSNELTGHLLTVQEQAEERMERIVEQMAAGMGVDEALKARDQMLWTRKMNSIRHSAEEIVLAEMIYI